MRLVIATSYFPIRADIRSNLRYVLEHMREARRRGAHVVHFPEACLSGYAGADFESYAGFDWKLLEDSTQRVLDEAGAVGIWVLLGSTHKLSGRTKPHNSVYVIDDRGRVVDRYDKRFCAGPVSEDSGDLAHYSSGNHFSVFTINAVRCGALVCHDARYPELYRQYKRRGVRVMFHSYHAGNVSKKTWKQIGRQVGERFHKLNRASTIPGIVFPATMQSMAANNHLWISCSNSSARQSCFPAFFVRADGVMTGRLRRNVAGLLISAVDTDESLYDSTVAWRDRAIEGIYHSGTSVRDKRSRIRTRI
jgi:deaminated glutathione amidase